MRNGFWLTVIALALAAIIAGYFEGASTSRPPPVASIRSNVRFTPLPVRVDTSSIGIHRSSDAAVTDIFSDDDVVVERPALASLEWQPERLSLVVGLCGTSLVVESGFFKLGVPIAIDLDPAAPDAARVAQAARTYGDRLFVHVSQAPNRTTLAVLRDRLGPFDGIAALDATAMPRALAGSGLTFFDERGEAADGAFVVAGVPIVHRDVTIDDRAAETYIGYMLERAAERSGRTGRAVVLMRPLPETLTAVKNFLRSHNPGIVSVE